VVPPYRRWLDAEITIGGDSDHMIRLDPIASTNPWDPWLGIWVAVTRKTEGGLVLNPDQKLTRLQALRFYTVDNARLHLEERDKGTVEPGELAVLILLDRDSLTCPEDDLKSTRLVWTMVGGKLLTGFAEMRVGWSDHPLADIREPAELLRTPQFGRPNRRPSRGSRGVKVLDSACGFPELVRLRTAR
jgi:hypothetical protein